MSVLPYVAVIVLGIASALYHATLKYSMQLRPSISCLSFHAFHSGPSFLIVSSPFN
jgi:hypothetical protein